MSGELLDVSFEATADDFVAYAAHIASSGEFYRSQMQHTRRLVVLLVVIATPLAASILTPDWSPWTMLLLVGIGLSIAVAVWFAWPAMWQAQLRAMTRRQAEVENPLVLYGPKRYIFDEKGVRYSGAYAGGYVMWPAVMRVSSDDSALYLHVSQASAHILPRRAFASDADFAAAGDIAARYASSHRSSA